MKKELYLGLDVHKDYIPTAAAEEGRRGEVRDTGNAHARCLLVECAQHYASPPKVSKELSRRQEGQSQEVRAISWRGSSGENRQLC